MSIPRSRHYALVDARNGRVYSVDSETPVTAAVLVDWEYGDVGRTYREGPPESDALDGQSGYYVHETPAALVVDAYERQNPELQAMIAALPLVAQVVVTSG